MKVKYELLHDLDFSAPSVLVPWRELETTHFYSELFICLLQNRKKKFHYNTNTLKLTQKVTV